MNLANLITVSRIVITAGCFVCLEVVPEPRAPEAVLVWSAFTLFIVAAATDFVDGYIARARGEVTAFGRIADPFADKVLVCGVLVILLKFPAAAVAIMDTWFVVIIVAREFLVTSIRGLAESQGQAFPAERIGKYKMVAQCVTASALMTLVAGTDRFEWVAVAGLWVTLVLTLLSAVHYVYRARVLLGA